MLNLSFIFIIVVHPSNVKRNLSDIQLHLTFENRGVAFKKTMNFVYLSPHFPPNYYFFCVHLRRLGANVLGLADTLALKRILDDKQIWCWVDLWGHDVNHDWPWWRRQMPYFLGHLGL